MNEPLAGEVAQAIEKKWDEIDAASHAHSFEQQRKRLLENKMKNQTQCVNPPDVILDGTKQSNTVNPKDAIGAGKLPLFLWPTTATAMGCLGFLDGMLKYGRSNFREVGIRASIYQDAAKRHIDAWFEGEDTDPDSGLPHLSHALACLAIIVDAQAAGKLTDDRMVAGGYRKLISSLTPHVARLKALHADKNPKHYTIEDSKAPS